MKLHRFALVILLTVAAVPAIAQDTQDMQDQPQPQTQSNLQPTKKENPAEPEAHGTRLQWKDLPANLWRDQKAIVSSPFHISRGNAKWWVLFGTGSAALLATDKKFSRDLPNSNSQLTVSRWAS